MMKCSPRTRRAVPAALIGSMLGLGVVLIPSIASAGAVDDVGVDLEIDVDLDLGLDRLPILTTTPAPTPSPTPPPAPAPSGGLIDLDADVDLDLGAQIGSFGVGDVTHHLVGVDVHDVDLDADVVVDPRRPVDGDVLNATLDDVRCVAHVVVVDASNVDCSGSAFAGLDLGLAAADAHLDICSVSVAILDEATQQSCANDGDENDGDDGDDGDGGDGGDSGDDDGDDGDDGDGDGDGDDGGVSSGGETRGTAGPSGIRTTQQADADQDASLPLTGSAILPILALATALLGSGIGAVAMKRRGGDG